MDNKNVLEEENNPNIDGTNDAEVSFESDEQVSENGAVDITDTADPNLEGSEITENSAESAPLECEDKNRATPKWLRASATALFTVIFAFIVVCGAFVLITSRKINVEIGETPTPEKIYSSEFLSSLYTVEKYTIDTSKPSSVPVRYTFFGFLPVHSSIEVCDTVPPAITLTDVYSVVGASLTAEDFVVSVSDSTYVTLTLSDIPSVPGEYLVTVTATDECGNKTEGEATLVLADSESAFISEAGHINAEAQLRKRFHSIVKMNTKGISSLTVGEHMIRAESEDFRYIWLLTVVDTVAPIVETQPISLRLGDLLEPSMAVSEVDEASAYTVSFLRVPKTDEERNTNVIVLFEDVSGNVTKKTEGLLIADIPKELQFEYGVTTNEIRENVLANTKFKDEFTIENLTSDFGEHDICVRYADFEYTVRVVIRDTEPPIITLTEATLYRGMTITPEIFVKSCSDISNVTFSFGDTAPSADVLGEQKVTVIALDEGGNETICDTVLYILDDTTPPVIYGVYEKTTVVGENVSFKKGVYAIDKENGEVSVKVDASAVNTSMPGRYPISYSATDCAGNTTTITSYYNVVEVSDSLVDSLADDVLAQITTADMSPYQKAEAIYNWTSRTIRYSTKTSYLMGNYVDAAYSGLTTKSGNCYVYYAVSSLLLTRAGIENIMIERDNPSNPHVWSLVKMDGSWYHFDTCPQYTGYELRCFLLTDKEVRAYSQNQVWNYYSFDASRYPATP